MRLYADTVTRLRAARVRDGGGVLTPQSDWAHATRTDVTGVSVQPVTTSETRDDAGVLPAQELRLYSRPGTFPDIQAGDRLEWSGQTFDVVGAPQVWPGHHVEVTFRRLPPTRTAATGLAEVLHAGELAAMPAQQWVP